jgi:hypothetical protein
MEKGFLKEILRTTQTVFTFKDLLLMWGGIDPVTAKKRVNYYIQTGDLYAIRRGIYAKDQSYDRFELATKIFTPAYISFETVLGSAGVTFQYYGAIFAATYQTIDIVADGQRIEFKRLKSSLLTNAAGIENRENYAIAIPERAFLDVVYLTKDYHFDQLSTINWDKVNDLLPIYGNIQAMKKRVTRYQQETQE